MRRPSRFRLTLRALFAIVTTICLGLAVFTALKYDFHRFVATLAVGIVVTFLAYQAIALLLDACRDLTDFINGDQDQPNQPRHDD
ncbi:hypothetical protein [Blastopirellula marina]|uniref:Uncharacterized protein n=1 Tax=Blastopirellula marina TaxID=124 RepID=A0A2S8FHS5_9BACT|nr:hypothetical protein [Blastopirellula marina]PQO31474.1 hypothetical protein C5Y98_18765 [Blastopirellula marina]PTL42779.1 hypothetical protein C5Y97_18775 [Blastopirellula marina]